METQEYSIIDVVYPVGSIYMSVNTSNPSTLFPNTTWQKIEGMFLLGSSSSYTSGNTGGSKDAVIVSHNHNQNAHNHGGASNYNFVESSDDMDLGMSTLFYPQSKTSTKEYSWMYSSTKGGVTEQPKTANTTATNQATGVSGIDKNMPPYLVVNIWKRTA